MASVRCSRPCTANRNGQTVARRTVAVNCSRSTALAGAAPVVHAVAANVASHRNAERRNVSVRSSTLERPVQQTPKLAAPGQHLQQYNVVYKFGGSSVMNAERMREVADIICSFPQYLPCVVLSAMGKTTNMLLECGDLALKSPIEAIGDLPPLQKIRELHLTTCDELGVDAQCKAEVQRLLNELQQLLVGVSIMQELTQRAKDSLVSFGERLSTRIFASYLRAQGIPARQYDAFSIGVTTTDDFTNAEIVYEESLPKVKQSLTLAAGAPKEVAIVTGFLGRAQHSGAITTLGRGGSDLTATLLGASLELSEVQVWKDVDGVLTSDPRIIRNTVPVDRLTFEEATELAYFGAQVLHPQAMQPAIRSGKMAVRVKNSYNRTADGSLITAARDMSNVLVTSVVLKNNVTLVDVVSTRMLGQYGFLATVFDIFKKNKISVDVVATSEVSVSLTLDPKKLADPEDAVESLTQQFQGVAAASYRKGLAIVSLVCNVQKTSEILRRVFTTLEREGINVQMMSQGASKTNISLVVDGSEGVHAVQALHNEFFPCNNGTCNTPLSTSAPATLSHDEGQK